MIRFTLAAALIAVSACAPVPQTPAARAQSCVSAFQNYDQSLLFDPDRIGLVGQVIPRPVIGVPGRRGAESALRQYDCVSFERDIARPAAADLAGLARPAAGTPMAPRYLHLGIVVSNQLEGRVRQQVAALGYPVRVKGADRLGRRMFIGPLNTVESMRNARALADVLGFYGAYPINRIP